jgi:hypothetical protein
MSGSMKVKKFDSFLRFFYFLSEQTCVLLQEFQLRFHKCEMSETESPLSHSPQFLCCTVYTSKGVLITPDSVASNEMSFFQSHSINPYPANEENRVRS